MAFLVWRPDLPLVYVLAIMGVVGTAIGLIYPVTTYYPSLAIWENGHVR